MKERYFSPPSESYFLFGPRGTGKSTFLRATYPDAYLIDLLLADNFQRFLARPDRLVGVVRALPAQSTVIIDEVQRVPALLSVVHHVMELRKDICFILTGSSSRKLKQEGTDLLAGRALKKELHPFMVSELGTIKTLDSVLQSGLLPLVLDSQTPIETLQSYLSLYMSDEVKAEGIVRNLEAFARFLEIISFSNAEQYNVSQIARECGVSRTSVVSYIEILEDLLVAYSIPVFAKRAKRKLVQSRKFFYFDVGVFRAVRPKGPLDSPEEINGAALETIVAQNIRAWIAYTQSRSDLYYWRTQSGSEVDFVLYGEDTFLAIEVKYSDIIRKKSLRGLQSFAKDYPEAQLVLLYMGNEPIVIDGIMCMPAIDFLQQLKPNVSPLSSPDISYHSVAR